MYYRNMFLGETSMAQKFDASNDMANAAPLATLEGNDSFLKAQHNLQTAPTPAPAVTPGLGI